MIAPRDRAVWIPQPKLDGIIDILWRGNLLHGDVTAKIDHHRDHTLCHKTCTFGNQRGTARLLRICFTTI